jgi:hypothetical protein
MTKLKRRQGFLPSRFTGVGDLGPISLDGKFDPPSILERTAPSHAAT